MVTKRDVRSCFEMYGSDMQGLIHEHVTSDYHIDRQDQKLGAIIKTCNRIAMDVFLYGNGDHPQIANPSFKWDLSRMKLQQSLQMGVMILYDILCLMGKANTSQDGDAEVNMMFRAMQEQSKEIVRNFVDILGEKAKVPLQRMMIQNVIALRKMIDQEIALNGFEDNYEESPDYNELVRAYAQIIINARV